MEYYVGAHIAKEGGSIIKTMKKIKEAGGNCLQIFASNPRSASEANIPKFIEIEEKVKEYCKENNFILVIHASYTINLAMELKINKRMINIENAYWVKSIISELIVSDIIGSIGVVVHVGKYVKLKPEEGLNNMKTTISYIVEYMKQSKIKSKLIIETPAGQGTELLVDLNDFRDFFNSFNAEQKKCLGICLDTAHVWSSGYEIYEAYDILAEHNKNDILIIHYNNSRREKGSKVDTHAPILNGEIENKSMKKFLKNIKENKHSPMILMEEPSSDIINEIKWIYNSLK